MSIILQNGNDVLRVYCAETIFRARQILLRLDRKNIPDDNARRMCAVRMLFDDIDVTIDG